jgi:hypothetical protein
VLDNDCLGRFERKYQCGDIQELTFAESDIGPFKFDPTERENRRYDKIIRKVRKEKTKSELLHELISKKQFSPTKNYSKIKLRQMAVDLQIDLHHDVDEVLEGWVGKPKGVLQILYERGFIDPTVLSEYSLDGRDQWKDEYGEIFPRYLPYCLRFLLAECSDFKNEVTAMEDLATKLAINDRSTVSIIYTPKYHCEIAGEGIEYSWGLCKRYYRNLPLQRKKGLNNFRGSVKESVARVSVESARKFSALTRRYMLAYSHYDTVEGENDNNQRERASYAQIERFVNKEAKIYRSVADIDSANITKVWRSSMNLPEQELL